MTTTHPAPSGLLKRSRQFWEDVTATYDLRVDELVTLEEACRTMDIIARLEAKVPKKNPTTTGSQGQMVIHPILPELARQRGTLDRLVKSLRLPDEAGTGSRSASARELANARWYGGASG